MMSENTKIEWADSTWNPVTGCTPISAGCKNCYAKSIANRFKGTCGYPADDPFKVTFHEKRLELPLKWKNPRKIFVCSMADLFHIDVHIEWLSKIFDVIKKCPQHTFIMLTKRPKRMDTFIVAWTGGYHHKIKYADINDAPIYKPLPNLWLGVTVEDQKAADERIPILIHIPAAKRFVSVEPMLEYVDLEYISTGPSTYMDALGGYKIDNNLPGVTSSIQGLDWVIVGAETGSNARYMNPNWATIVRSQCNDKEVPFFFKKMSGGVPIPDELKIREWPE